jgi:hypothetical protein
LWFGSPYINKIADVIISEIKEEERGHIDNLPILIMVNVVL